MKPGHIAPVIDPTGEAIERLTPIDDTGKTVHRGRTDDEILDLIPPDPELVVSSLMFLQDRLEAHAVIHKIRERPTAMLVAGGELRRRRAARPRARAGPRAGLARRHGGICHAARRGDEGAPPRAQLRPPGSPPGSPPTRCRPL